MSVLHIANPCEVASVILVYFASSPVSIENTTHPSLLGILLELQGLSPTIPGHVTFLAPSLLSRNEVHMEFGRHFHLPVHHGGQRRK